MASGSDNFKFPFALSIKKRKTFHLEDLPQFKWKEIGGQEVIGQGAFGAVFISSYNSDCGPRTTVATKRAKTIGELLCVFMIQSYKYTLYKKIIKIFENNGRL